MQAFDDAIMRVDEIHIPNEWKPVFISVMQKLSQTLDSMEGLDADFNKMFEEKLYNNLKFIYDEESPDGGILAGYYSYPTNTIGFKCVEPNEELMCHEFIHFIIYNLYPYQFRTAKSSEHMPNWADESLTEELTIKVLDLPSSMIAYWPVRAITKFIERNIGATFSLEDFLNGKTPEFIEHHKLRKLEKDLDLFTSNYVEDSGYEARSRVIAHYYNIFIEKQLSNPNIKLEELLFKLAEYETLGIYDGKVAPFTIDNVGRWLKPEHREKLFNERNLDHLPFIQRVILSKGVRAVLPAEQMEVCNSFVKNYLSYLKKKIFEQHRSTENYTDEELQSPHELPQIKKILNDACRSVILKENEQQEEQELNSFFSSFSTAWAPKDNERFETNIQRLNSFSNLFNSPLSLTQKAKCLTVGTAYGSYPLFDVKSKDATVSTFDEINIEDLHDIAKSLEHGEQCNLVIKINNEPISVGNLMRLGDGVGLSINWQGIWDYLPKEVQSQIKATVIKHADISSQDWIH